MCRCFWYARGLCLCVWCVTAPRGFTSFPTQEVEYCFWGFIPTNKQTNKQYVVCIAVFGTHVVCASARVWSLPGALLPSQHRRQSIVFRILFQQTNKQTYMISIHQIVHLSGSPHPHPIRQTRQGGTPFGGWGCVLYGAGVSPGMRASLSTCRVLTINWQVRDLCCCLWYARGLCLCPCVITPRGFTSLPTQEAE